jgi:hypothetical protein
MTLTATAAKIPLLLIAFVACARSLADERLPAFRGAEGFGATTPGGRGGKVLLVTTLDDYLPKKEQPIAGSLRWACQAAGPRLVAFGVGGLVELKAPLRITEPALTILGQTAPGGGLCLKNYGLEIRDTHDVVVQHLRVRPGDVARQPLDGLSVYRSQRVVIDHCSVSWAIDETLSVTGAGCSDVTVQWCLISESLHDSVHPKGPHGYGSLIVTGGNVTFHHNIYAHHSNRCPRPGTGGEGSLLLDFRNNVIHDGKGYSSTDRVRMNYVGNAIHQPRGPVFRVGGPATLAYAQGNQLVGKLDADDWSLFADATGDNRRDEPFDCAPVTTHKAAEAYELVLAACGATLPKRDAVDARVVDQIRSGTKRLINSQDDVGGWPDLDAGEPPTDNDQDGLPDEWERTHRLDPENGNDSADLATTGYAWLEEYAHSLAAQAKTGQ